MRKLLGVFALVAFSMLVTSCSTKTPPTSPQQVEVQDVKTVLLASSSTSNSCELEIRDVGGEILYRNEFGLLFTNLEKDKLPAVCNALLVNENEAETTPNVRLSEERNLEELMKLLPSEEIGATSFIGQNPKFDGRGVIVAILDTGLELNHPMLKQTTTGERKIIDVQDLSGQGKLRLSSVQKDAEGNLTLDGKSWLASTIDGQDFRLGVFGKDRFGQEPGEENFTDYAVVTYQKGSKTFARIDTNNNDSFDDDKDLQDFREQGDFATLGKRKPLSAAIKISEDRGSLNLVFDDGSHGTHVAGIVAGNGTTPLPLKGVAPGAQLIGGKIGDNRLAGGSTTTASKLLAIDWAVKNNAKVINISYGIRSGSNVGKSLIDEYVDKIAYEKDILFAISAGNEGPGLNSVGTPAAADRALTVAAYVSKQTAHRNYGYVGVERDNVWYFSSVGPRLGGGFKPSIAAPGSALSSIPLWDDGHATYRGTSMAAPQVAGGLALLLSGAKQAELPQDRISITRAVYRGAAPVEGLSLIEQGHGLMNVPAAFEQLQDRRDETIVEYALRVNNTLVPSGAGQGIFVRSPDLSPRVFTVRVSPVFSKASKTEPLFFRSFNLKPSADWIQTPNIRPHFSLTKSGRTFQVKIDPKAYEALEPGIYSEKITAKEENSGATAFTVPVTLIKPHALTLGNESRFLKNVNLAPGETKRIFVSVPPGATHVKVNLSYQGPLLWGQFLDPEGRLKADLFDRTQTQIGSLVSIDRPGVYEMDVSAPAQNGEASTATIEFQLMSLNFIRLPPTSKDDFEVLVQNNLDPVNIVPKVSIKSFKRQSRIEVGETSQIQLKTEWSQEDAKLFSGVKLGFLTSKSVYDQLTDYPYLVFCPDGRLLDSGGLGLNSTVDIHEDLCFGQWKIHVEGAFTSAPPESWSFQLTETRDLLEPQTLFAGRPTILRKGQSISIPVPLSKAQDLKVDGFQQCVSVEVNSPSGSNLGSREYCE